MLCNGHVFFFPLFILSFYPLIFFIQMKIMIFHDVLNTCVFSLNFFSVGLDAAGKTTILYKLKLGEIVTTIPTIGKILLWLFQRILTCQG